MNCVVHTIHITMDMMMVATVAAAAAAVAVVWFSSTLYMGTHYEHLQIHYATIN